MNDTKTLVAGLRIIAKAQLEFSSARDAINLAADRMEELEREHGSPADAADPNGSTHARLKWWKNRNGDLHEQLAALTEDVGKCHDALGEDRASDTSELWKFFETHKQVIARLRAREDELAETQKDFLCLAELLDGHDATECRANLVRLKADLSAERAIADRLAKSMSGCPSAECDNALAAWKEARRE